MRSFLHTVWRDFWLRVSARPKLSVAIVLLAAAGVYAAVFGWVLSQRYEAFQTFAWDLGIYNQAFYTTLYSHRLFYYTADLPSGGIGTLLGVHFSPFLFLLLPFYAAASNPPGLLVIEAAGLAAGVFPLFFLSRRAGLPYPWAFLVAAAYLLSPVLMGVGWYDFHAEAFLPVTVLFTVYCYYYAGRWTFVGSWLLCLSVIETVSPLLLLFAVAGIIGLIFDWFKGVDRPRQTWEKTVIAAIVVPIWLGVAEAFALFVNRAQISTFGTSYSGSFSVLGPNLSFMAVVPYALVHPSAALAAIEFDWTNKLAYAVVLFGSMAFLPLFGPKRLLLPVAGWLVLVALSTGGALIQFGDQYSAYGFSFLVAGMPLGLVRVRALWTARSSVNVATDSHPPPERRRTRFRRIVGPSATASAVVLAVTISSGMISPLLANPSWSYADIAHGIPVETPHDLLLHQIIDLIPPTAGVLTISPIFPEVSDRLHAYVVPTSSSFRPGLTFDEALDGYVNSSQYVLIDYFLDFFDSSVLVSLANLSGFGVLAEGDQILLLDRGWTGPPQVWVPTREAWCGNQLYPTNYSYEDSGNVTGCGASISSLPKDPWDALLWYGPYKYGLLPGRYSASFWVSVTAQQAGTQLRIDSVSYGLTTQLFQSGPTSVQHTYGFALSNSGSQSILNSTYLANPGPGPRAFTTNMTVSFDWSADATWGANGWVYSTGAEIHLFSVTLQQLAP